MNTSIVNAMQTGKFKDDNDELITLDVAQRLIAEAVATKGEDFIYNPQGGEFGAGISCVYHPDALEQNEVADNHPAKTTGCLIGVALTLHGIKRHQRFHGDVSAVCQILKVRMSRDALVYFKIAQTAQDRGLSWGESKAAADRFYFAAGYAPEAQVPYTIPAMGA